MSPELKVSPEKVSKKQLRLATWNNFSTILADYGNTCDYTLPTETDDTLSLTGIESPSVQPYDNNTALFVCASPYAENLRSDSPYSYQLRGFDTEQLQTFVIVEISSDGENVYIFDIAQKHKRDQLVTNRKSIKSLLRVSEAMLSKLSLQDHSPLHLPKIAQNFDTDFLGVVETFYDS